MNPAILIGAAVALVISFGKRRGPSSRSRPCPPLSFGAGSLAGYDYLEFVTGEASSKDRLPIVILLHGRGGSPELLFEHVRNIQSRARIILPRGHLGTKSNPLWFELRAATEDQETLANQMSQEANSLARFVEEINFCLKGLGKPVLAGHSQGGMMALAVAARAPSLARGVAAASGWLPVPLWPRRLPLTILVHGANDTIVDFTRTEDFASRANSAGLPVEFISIDGHGHGLSGELKASWLASIKKLIEM